MMIGLVALRKGKNRRRNVCGKVEEILSQLGLTVSETVHLLYRQIKLQRGLPFDVRIPNELTVRTLNSSKAGRGVKRFGSKKELYADLGL